MCATGGVHTLRVARTLFRHMFLAWRADIKKTPPTGMRSGGGRRGLLPPPPPLLLYAHSVSHAHFSDTCSLRGVQTSRTRMAQGVRSAPVMSLHLTLSILMFHPPSLLFPDGHFETTFAALTSAPSLPNCSRSESAGQAHERRRVWLPGRSHAPHRL